ncbi:non-hydrolyzing UDP-N-acetylglucosamine 2-epimerase [Sphingomonas sinipercae]|uniref:non-hydrolyzing UDP-N-acetylglucosamine 2-epimerase n=1 Tax=Sphingomonas sinipercae TaxID=2714944 RepID=UPI0019D1F36E|nr:UDP-N-acetylglucosamine 2-epimerase (non-hydrolyzing) [Sphingomonas sinipercae]
MPRLIFTGQHPLSPADYGLCGYPAIVLDCAGGADPLFHVERVRTVAGSALAGCSLVIVQGDTSSALGGALAAADRFLAVAHVEAGLRSHDRRQPWPEEDFRRRIDSLAALLFAPTALSAANLRRERIAGAIHITGNTGIDAVLRLRQEREPHAVASPGLPRILVTCHRRESWGAGLAGIASALRSLADSGAASIDVVLHPNPTTARFVADALRDVASIRLSPPLPHVGTIDRLARADLVLSDSGGLQEECAALRVPLLVLRERTERPEAIACGAMRLVGTDPDRILHYVGVALRGRALVPRQWVNPYGDGRASERIAALIVDALARSGAILQRTG